MTKTKRASAMTLREDSPLLGLAALSGSGDEHMMDTPPPPPPPLRENQKKKHQNNGGGLVSSLLARQQEERQPRSKSRGIVCMTLALVAFVLFLFWNHGIFQPSSTGERSVKQKQHKKESNNGPRYRATQFISFTINTMGGLADRGECEGRKVDNNGVCYLGNASNLTDDVQHRVAIVQEVLDRLEADAISENPMIDHSDDVLKIFMLPEFFTRGPHGAYSTAEFMEGGILLDVADDIHDAISKDEFSDYFFVFGTVIAAQSPNDPRKPWEHATSAEEVLYFNFAPAYKGGRHTEDAHNHRYMISKKYISTVDFLNRTNLPNPTNADMHEYADITPDLKQMLKSRHVEIIEDNVIEMDGLRIGLEICLDHRLGVLWEGLQESGEDLVDIQLITSAGMAIERGPNPVVPGGVVYLTDGEASSAACRRADSEQFDPEKVCRKGVDGLKHIPQGIGPQYYSNFFTLQSCIDVFDPNLYNGYYSLYQTQGCANTLKLYGINVMDEFKEYPPSIEVYPTVELPRNTYNKND